MRVATKVSPAAVSNALREAENTLESATSNYLRAFGWEITCQTPGSLWLWRRDFSGDTQTYGVMIVPADTALYMTRAVLDEGDDE